MNKLLKTILRIFAKLTLARYQPRVVAITGSVGKTSTKEAIVMVLKTKFSVRGSFSNYNNEIGVPLTIIDEPSGGRNPFAWLWIFIKAKLKLISTDYPQVLVLELGTDRPGDIGYLVDMVGRIDTAVITSIGISHLEFFQSPEALAKEKLSLIRKLPKTSTAVLNFDSPKIHEGSSQTKANVISFGFSETDLMISDVQIIKSGNTYGVNFKIHYNGNVVPFFLPEALGKPAVYAATAAVAVGLSFGMNLVEISEALKNFQAPSGRLRLIEGIKHTKIIDDTYNAAPDSTTAALEVLHQIATGRKLVAIGEMAELGSKSESGHREIGAKIIENQIDLVFLVGSKTKAIQDELKSRQFAGRVMWFETSDSARIPIQDALLENDTILVKGSQSARMEKIVKELMADPESAERLLVRQSDKWLK